MKNTSSKNAPPSLPPSLPHPKSMFYQLIKISAIPKYRALYLKVRIHQILVPFGILFLSPYYSQMRSSVATRKFLTSFWQVLDKFDDFRFETGQSDFQNKSEHVKKNVACLFVKFQRWNWSGQDFARTLTKAYWRSILFRPNFGQI